MPSSAVNTHRQGMLLLVENVQDGVGCPILDVVVDGQGDAFDGVLEVGLAHRGVIDVYGGAAARLLQVVKVA